MGFRERLAALVAALLTVGILATPSSAFDPEQTFHTGAVLLSLEGGGGVETQLRENVPFSDIEFWNLGIRLSMIPFGTTGSGVLHNVLYGALELGSLPLHLRHPITGLGAWQPICMQMHRKDVDTSIWESAAESRASEGSRRS